MAAGVLWMLRGDAAKRAIAAWHAGWAQAVQAEAAGVEAQVEMNPVLLKPEADHISQVVLMGRPMRSARTRDYFGLKPQLWQSVSSSLDSLRESFDLVIAEGAGSPAEINLKATEIVNMRVALYANSPVLLCGDIDRGGVAESSRRNQTCGTGVEHGQIVWCVIRVGHSSRSGRGG